MSKQVTQQHFSKITLIESAAGDAPKPYAEVDLVVIRAGKGNSLDNVFYPEEALKASVPLYNHAPIYVNHATWREEMDRPERDFHEKVGVLTEARWDAGISGVAARARFYDPPVVAKLRAMREAGALDHAAMSIVAEAMGVETDDGSIRVTTMLRVLSVDLVTAAGAGGVIRTVEGVAGTRKIKEEKSVELSELEKKVALLEAENKELRAKEAANKLNEERREVISLSEANLAAEAASSIKDRILSAPNKETAMLIYESARAAWESVKGKIPTKTEKTGTEETVKLNLGESGSPKTETAPAVIGLSEADRKFVENSRRARGKANGLSGAALENYVNAG